MRSSPFAELTAVRDYRTHLQTVLKRSPPVAAVRARERALVARSATASHARYWRTFEAYVRRV